MRCARDGNVFTRKDTTDGIQGPTMARGVVPTQLDILHVQGGKRVLMPELGCSAPVPQYRRVVIQSRRFSRHPMSAVSYSVVPGAWAQVGRGIVGERVAASPKMRNELCPSPPNAMSRARPPRRRRSAAPVCGEQLGCAGSSRLLSLEHAPSISDVGPICMGDDAELLWVFLRIRRLLWAMSRQWR